MEYNARLEFNTRPSEDAGSAIVDALASFHPAAGATDTKTLDVWITLQASSVAQAVEVALGLAARASSAELLALEVITTAEFDRRQSITHVPELVGTAEAAEILGISRQAVGDLVDSGVLPGHRIGERGIAIAKADAVTLHEARRRAAGR